MSDLSQTAHTTPLSKQQFLRIANLFWIASVSIFIITLIVIIIKIVNSSDVVALRYNIIVGVSEIGSRYQLLQLLSLIHI